MIKHKCNNQCSQFILLFDLTVVSAPTPKRPKPRSTMIHQLTSTSSQVKRRQQPPTAFPTAHMTHMTRTSSDFQNTTKGFPKPAKDNSGDPSTFPRCHENHLPAPSGPSDVKNGGCPTDGATRMRVVKNSFGCWRTARLSEHPVDHCRSSILQQKTGFEMR